MRQFIHAFLCYLRNDGHLYGEVQWGPGPHGYRVAYRVCWNCGWTDLL